MSDQEPTWTEEDGMLRTYHGDHSCWVNPSGLPSPTWGVRGPGAWKNAKHGVADSVEIAKVFALRTAEALDMLDRCERGDPPESSGFPAEFSATDPSLPTPVGVFIHEVEGKVAGSLWANKEDGAGVVIGVSEICASRDEFLRQLGEHLVHLGKYGWTDVDPEQRKELFGAQVTDSGDAAAEDAQVAQPGGAGREVVAEIVTALRRNGWIFQNVERAVGGESFRDRITHPNASMTDLCTDIAYALDERYGAQAADSVEAATD